MNMKGYSINLNLQMEQNFYFINSDYKYLFIDRPFVSKFNNPSIFKIKDDNKLCKSNSLTHIRKDWL